MYSRTAVDPNNLGTSLVSCTILYVKQQKPTNLEEAFRATLEIESYLRPSTQVVQKNIVLTIWHTRLGTSHEVLVIRSYPEMGVCQLPT